MHERRVLQHRQLRPGQPQVPPDGHPEPGDAAGVPGRGVPGDLGGAGQGGDGLPVGGTDGRVPAVGELGEQQRHGEDGQRPQARDAHRERHHGTGRTHRGGDPDHAAQLFAQQRPEGPAGARVRGCGGEHGVAQGGQGEEREQQQRVGGAAPVVEDALVGQGPEADGGEADGEHAPRQGVEDGTAAAGDVGHAAQQGGGEHDADGLGDAVVRGLPGDVSEQRVRQRARGPERSRLPGLGTGAPGQLAEGDEAPEGERHGPLLGPRPEHGGEAPEREEAGTAGYEEQRRRPRRPGRLAGAPGRVRAQPPARCRRGG